jgi:hypothetical protein
MTRRNYLDMNFKRYRPHTWLEIEETDLPNSQPISQITKLKEHEKIIK